MAATVDEIAQSRIRQLEVTNFATEKRNGELARQVNSLTAENDRLQQQMAELTREAQTLRLRLAGQLPVEDDL